MEIRRVINVLLGSSLPFMGGGDTMTAYEKLSLLIQFSMLIVEVIRCFYSSYFAKKYYLFLRLTASL